ncbi:Zinc finger, C2H2 [Penicillium griseofulvum]|uniref:pH-response transcription factor pacC/RIM101 n=1 Tax=Penicillium patulum TaxID=5078 RepID=A0A135LIJ1_PENPA|nr:Zinc finger, C2H2 [Penicillium griseofulvum]KXG48783.1 Zinc finger, C2H2 [Penicillium griseofulvum]
MTENHTPSTTQATLPTPVSEPAPIQATPTPSASVTATAAAATAAVNSPSMNGAGEQLPCQWVGCTEKSATAESLYEHVCERHVGRKSTNNLNLTCQWGTCNTTTVKRDHITSHIRVHVPLKPHKCDFCGKAFKRPQDLKKHVKTHADDSEIRSPEPGMKHPDMMFPQNPKGYAAATHYFESPINGINGQYSHAPPPQYYQPHPPPQAPNPHSYGNVYYALSQGQEGNHPYDRKRGYDALNEFFGDLKRRQFDPNSYAAVGQRLLGLQALQLPFLNGPVPEYQQMPASVAVGGGGGGGGYSPGGSHPPGYHLPPMSNVRTKNDLINIDQFLEQMQNTIYESDENVAAAGVAQPGAHYVHGMNYRATHSPPTQLPPSHVTATTSAPMGAASAHSPSVGTPALTPPSSAQSYTSNRSPISMHQAHRVSPPHESGPGMYPRLPSATVADSMNAGYPTASGAAPPSTLSGAYDHDDRRRYTGGTLQRARPAERAATEDRMDTSQDSKTPAIHISESLIDPALSGNPDQEAVKRTAQAATEVADRDVNVAWVEKVRLLENLRRLVSDLLEADSLTAGYGTQSSASPTPGLDAMEGVESGRAASEQPKEESAKPTNEGVFYPTLRSVDEDEDGDSKMPE